MTASFVINDDNVTIFLDNMKTRVLWGIIEEPPKSKNDQFIFASLTAFL